MQLGVGGSQPSLDHRMPAVPHGTRHPRWPGREGTHPFQRQATARRVPLTTVVLPEEPKGITVRCFTLSAAVHLSEEFLESYADLPADEHLRDGHRFRYRAFGKAQVKGERFLWEDEVSFFQEGDINAYAGGRERKFAPLGDAAREFAESFVNSRRTRGIVTAEEFHIGCHQIRITADDEHPGLPAPEGFHQDGFDYVAVTCVATENVSGGISLVRAAEPDGDDLVERVMPPGEALFLADREVLHYVSPITPKVPGRPTYRDVAVITFTLEGAAR
ncbi:2OG-Fe dioxygenase family protein [Streptomyces niger]|uniref:2OG-Fe dioxygenase family protein n=1 Tax=Streptomyces niger TaxID=66373 RepID=UPI001F209E82|nr:2OG-Fe dioxygenase family protein [Streptomyces niger]